MSYAQGTTHYDFPQITASDRPTFADNNAAFRIIDEKLFGFETSATAFNERLNTAEENISELEDSVTTAQSTANTANTKADTNTEQIGLINTELSQHNTRITGKLDSVAIADPYLSTTTYSVGDVVTYNGQRYKCITAITTGEPFDVSKWEGEDVQTVIDKLNNSLLNQHVMYEQKRHSFGFTNPTDLADALHQTAEHILSYLQGLSDGVSAEILNMKFIGAGSISFASDTDTIYDNTATDFSIHCFTNVTSGTTMYLYDMICWANTASANRISRASITDGANPTFSNLTLSDLSTLTGFNFDIRTWKKL